MWDRWAGEVTAGCAAVAVPDAAVAGVLWCPGEWWTTFAESASARVGLFLGINETPNPISTARSMTPPMTAS